MNADARTQYTFVYREMERQSAQRRTPYTARMQQPQAQRDPLRRYIQTISLIFVRVAHIESNQ